MDEYIQNYILEAINNIALDEHELHELLSTYIEDPQIINDYMEVHRNLLSPDTPPPTLPSFVVQETKKSPPLSHLDPHTKKSIIDKYFHGTKDVAQNMTMPKYLRPDGEIKTKVRFRNSMIVSNKGEKYITEEKA